MTAATDSGAVQLHPNSSPLRRFLLNNRAALGTLLVFVVMMAIFIMANPAVFLAWPLYSSVLVTLPVALFLVVPLVFVVTVGEIDLSFPATMGFSAWIFALLVQAGLDPFVAILGAVVTGIVLGTGVGAIVVYAGLSSLIATLGIGSLAVALAALPRPELLVLDDLDDGLQPDAQALVGETLARVADADGCIILASTAGDPRTPVPDDPPRTVLELHPPHVEES